jgi:hypothetical protein
VILKLAISRAVALCRAVGAKVSAVILFSSRDLAF